MNEKKYKLNFCSRNIAKECPAGKVYTECASNCPKTCQNIHQNFTGIDCKEDCSPGCVCPDKHFIDPGLNSTCVRADKCSCLYQGKFYNTNQRVTVDCNEWYAFSF